MDPALAHQSLESAQRLGLRLRRLQGRDGALRGPDSGLRLQWRLWRFFYSAFPGFPRPDRHHAYCQAQGYWIRSSWLLQDLTSDQTFGQAAVAAAEYLVEAQLPAGGWAYPAAERRGLVSTTEGNWATIGLIETGKRTGRTVYLDAAARWLRYLRDEIRFVQAEAGTYVNYFDRRARIVPNNTSEALWVLAELERALGEDVGTALMPEMVRFLRGVQTSEGEIPYRLPSSTESGWAHYLCAQYNAFQALCLARYFELRQDASVLPVLEGLGRFLLGQTRPGGEVAYQCGRWWPRVPYFASAAGAALLRLSQLGVVNGMTHARSVQARLLATQRSDGSYVFSQGDYNVPWMSDGGVYPRTLAMQLYFHLLWALSGRESYKGWTCP